MRETTEGRLERLQSEVKTGWSNSHSVWSFDVSDIKWLVDRAVQAEPILLGVAELNGFLAMNKELAKEHWGESVTKTAMDELERLQEENTRLREALEFYAKRTNYYSNVTDQWEPVIPVSKDQGFIARKVLLEGATE